jgi:hypothetical protein
MKSVEFDHNGKSYSLRMDINAMARASDILGGEDTATTFIEFDKSVLDVRRTRALFAAGLNIRLPLDAAGQMAEDMGVYEVKALVSRAMQEAMPAITPPNAKKPQEPKDGAESGNAKG